MARNIAAECHAGQFRRDGITPYIIHPEKVAEIVEKIGGGTQEIAAQLNVEIAKLWDDAIRKAIIRHGFLPDGFNPKHHISTLHENGRIFYQPDGTKEFRWNDKTLLIGGWIDGKIGNGYEIKPII